MGCVSRRNCGGSREFAFLSEGYGHEVAIPRAFAVSRHEVTFAQWEACVSAGGCGHVPGDQEWGRGQRPVMNVTWEDAQDYAAWLSEQTGGEYRLLSEAEWEYAARAGSSTEFSWGNSEFSWDNDVASEPANCRDCASAWEGQTAPVGSFPPNHWGLHDMHGNVWEWVQDCKNDSYDGAPSNGESWEEGDCSARILRGGSLNSRSRDIRSAVRGWAASDASGYNVGLRVARTLSP